MSVKIALLLSLIALPVAAQPSVEILPTENVEKLEKPEPATAGDIRVNVFANRIQPGDNSEFANISITVAALRNIEVAVVLTPSKGQAILSNTDAKQILEGTTASFSGIATKGNGVIQVVDTNGAVIKELDYKVGKRKSIRQNIGLNVGYNVQENTGSTTFSQNARYGVSDVKGDWNVFVNVNRSEQSSTGQSYGGSVGVNFNID